DDVDGVGELRGEFLLPPRAQEPEHHEGQHEAAEQRGDDGVQQAPLEHHGGRERPDHTDNDDQDQPSEADGQAGLQHELIETDERQPIFAAAGQPALAPQLHQHAFAVRLVVHHLEAAVDVMAVGRLVVEQQIDAFREHRRRDADQQIHQIDRIEVEHGASERLRGIEKIAGELDALVDEMGEKTRAHAGGREMALHGAVRPSAGAYVFEDFLHLDDVAFQPGYFRDRRDLALAVRLARELHDELDGAGDLAADRGHRHRQARDGVARRIGVNGGHRAFVAGVHRLQHVEGFLAAALAEDDAVGPHAQRVLDQLALADFALALDIGRPRLHAADMRLLQLKLGGVFDGDQALFFRDEGGQRIEHGGLAGAGAARNDRGDARLHRRPEQLGHRRTQRADFHQPAEVERLLRKFADRDQGAIDADRPHRNVDARAVLQARVAKRMRFVDAAADRGHDFIDDAQQVILVLEAHRQRLKYAAALYIN